MVLFALMPMPVFTIQTIELMKGRGKPFKSFRLPLKKEHGIKSRAQISSLRSLRPRRDQMSSGPSGDWQPSEVVWAIKTSLSYDSLLISFDEPQCLSSKIGKHICTHLPTT